MSRVGLRHKAAIHFRKAQDSLERAEGYVMQMRSAGATSGRLFMALSQAEAAATHLRHAHDLMKEAESE